MSTNYPLAETFFSIQGEGIWTGTPMFFVRLAGCNVGKYNGGIHTTCTSWCGEEFTCDTDYRNKQGKVTADSLITQCRQRRFQHLCVTGGEPFIHDLVPLMKLCRANDIKLHVETSGTLPFNMPSDSCWITCSPKEGFLKNNFPRVDEWKFIIGPQTKISAVEKFLQPDLSSFDPLPQYQHVYLQALADEPIIRISGETDFISTFTTQQHVIDTLLTKHPEWCLSTQLHKQLRLP